MFNTNFDYLINEYMVYCRSRQLRAKTLNSYEQALRLFERWCKEQMSIDDVAKITDSVIRRYINDLQERGKYTFYCNDIALSILCGSMPIYRCVSAALLCCEMCRAGENQNPPGLTSFRTNPPGDRYFFGT